MLRPHRFVLICLVVFSMALLAGALRVGDASSIGGVTVLAQAVPTGGHMTDHFAKVEDVQNAVIRGDLEGMREPAKWLAEHKADQGLPATSATQISAMQNAAKRAADATDIKTAADATATMAATCGTCHRSTKVTPRMPDVPAIEGKGVQGHMLAHQRAVDFMYQGLAAPSDRLWVQGADLLKASPMAKEDFPSDPKLTDEIKAYEVKIHELAGRARKASDPKSRVMAYAEVISSCAQCHSLHGKAWGPGLPK
jgi:cytochrome c553